MSNISTETDHLKTQPKIRKALDEASGKNSTKRFFTKKEKNKVLTFLTIIATSVIIQNLLSEQLFSINQEYLPYISKFFGSLIAITFVMLLVNLLRIFLIKNINNQATQYNLKRVINLAGMILVSIIILTTLYSNWYAAVISLGLISLILGFALQNPITSFFAWVYIIVRKPYEVGDRIKIGHVTGDVIE